MCHTMDQRYTYEHFYGSFQLPTLLVPYADDHHPTIFRYGDIPFLFSVPDGTKKVYLFGGSQDLENRSDDPL